MSPHRMTVEVEIPEAEVVRLVDAVHTEVFRRLCESSPILNPRERDGFLTAQGAADYLGVSRKRVHDLTSMRAIVPDGYDGRTPLYTRMSLDNYVSGSLTRP